MSKFAEDIKNAMDSIRRKSVEDVVAGMKKIESRFMPAGFQIWKSLTEMVIINPDGEAFSFKLTDYTTSIPLSIDYVESDFEYRRIQKLIFEQTVYSLLFNSTWEI